MSILADPAFHRIIIGGLFIVAGLLHFINPYLYIDIMPGYIPYKRKLVFLSGIFEIIGGVGILISTTHTYAAWGLILLLFAVFPANFDMVCKSYKKRGLKLATWLLIARLPLQFILMFWVYWAGVIN